MLKVRTKGLKQAQKGIARATAKVLHGVQSGLIIAGKNIEKTAKANAPVDTGNLRRSAYTLWPKRNYITLPVFKRVGIRNTITRAQLARITANHPRILKREFASLKPAVALQEAIVKVGFTVMYAVYPHENMTNPKSKYLERAVAQHMTQMPKLVHQNIYKALKATQLDRFDSLARRFAEGQPL